MKQLSEHQVPEDHDLQDGQHRGQALVVAGANGTGAGVWGRRRRADYLRGVAPDVDRAGRRDRRELRRVGC